MVRSAFRLLVCLALLAGGLGVVGPAQAEQAWEREVQRAKREQDRGFQRAQRRGDGMANVVRRYRQRVRDKDNALNNYLLGRAVWYGAKDRLERKIARKTRPTEADRKWVEGETDQALQHMGRAMQLNPNFYFAELAMTVIHLSRRDAEAAKRHLGNLRRLAPDLPDGIRLHAQLLMAEGRTDGVEPAMLRLLKKDPSDTEARRLLVAVYADGKKWQQALPHVEKLIEGAPSDPDLRLMKIDALLGLERWNVAENEILVLLRLVGENPIVLQRLVDARLEQEDLDGAVATIRRMLKAAPKSWQIRAMLIDALMNMGSREGALGGAAMQKGDEAAAKKHHQASRGHHEAALKEIETLQKMLASSEWQKLEPIFLWHRSVALASLERFEEAIPLLVKLDALRDEPVLHVLDLLQQIYAQIQQHEKRLAVLERMVPLVKVPEARAKLEEAIAAMKAGRAAAPGQTWSQDVFSDLLERCIHPDPAVRRKGLFEYFEADVPFVDSLIYRRYDPDVEPDQECRVWVVRILGKFRVDVAEPDVVRDVARYVGLALEDPTTSVRRVAYEELGRIGTKAGILYMLPHFSTIPLQPPPKDAEARRLLEQEFNAARLALVRLTGRQDTEIGEPEWVPLANAAETREGWRLWFEGPEGIRARLDSLADIASITDVNPTWQLRYILQDLVRPAPDEIALETYRVLRDAILRIDPKERATDPWWPTFPLLEDSEVTKTALPDIRKKVRAWWAALPKRGAAASRQGDDGGGRSGGGAGSK